MKTIISTVGTSLLSNLRKPERNPTGLTDPHNLLKANPQGAGSQASALARLVQATTLFSCIPTLMKANVARQL